MRRLEPCQDCLSADALVRCPDGRGRCPNCATAWETEKLPAWRQGGSSARKDVEPVIEDAANTCDLCGQEGSLVPSKSGRLCWNCALEFEPELEKNLAEAQRQGGGQDAMKPEIKLPTMGAALESPALLDVEAVARLLSCSTRHVRRLADSGRMPWPLKLGTLIRWKRSEVE